MAEQKKNLNVMNDHGMVVRDVIKRYGLTQAVVAERMGLKPASMCNALDGNPSIKFLFELAKAIGCKITEFFGEHDQGVIKSEPVAEPQTEEQKKDWMLTCPHCKEDITFYCTVSKLTETLTRDRHFDGAVQ